MAMCLLLYFFLFKHSPYFLSHLICLKKFWCQLPEDGEIITPKHVGAI